MSRVKDHIEEAHRPASRETTHLGSFVLANGVSGEKVPAFVVAMETQELSAQDNLPLLLYFGAGHAGWRPWGEVGSTSLRIDQRLIDKRDWEGGAEVVNAIDGYEDFFSYIDEQELIKKFHDAWMEWPFHTAIVEDQEPTFGELFERESVFEFVSGFNKMMTGLEVVNRKWNTDLVTGEPIKRDALHMLMLVTTEIAEAAEGVRKDLMDDHLPERKMEEVELADAIIRIMDYANVRGLDVAGAMIEKIEYNMTRSDHKREARLAEGGKKV
uniref:Nucleoside triphosphate pyrophosphohydrolase protein n=1 Tax=Pseudomonas phage GEC_MRC TaxID=3158843 RepID=A0AAU7P217_9VIRU